MKKYKYTCDRGGILVGSRTFRALFPNEPGDGTWDVIVMEREEQTKAYGDDHFKYVGCLEGEFSIYKEDCLHLPGDFMNKDNIICTLYGTYHVFAERGDYSGTMLFVHQKARCVTKLSGRFVRKPMNIYELQTQFERTTYPTVPIRQVARVNLSADEWDDLIHAMDVDREYVKMYANETGMSDTEMLCIIVTTDGDERKIAIDAEGYNYPRYAALVIEEEKQW